MALAREEPQQGLIPLRKQAILLIRVLLIGDIVGKPGRSILKAKLPSYINDQQIDFVIANGENAAQGSGITDNLFREIVNCGVDCVTCGDHVWRRKEI